MASCIMFNASIIVHLLSIPFIKQPPYMCTNSILSPRNVIFLVMRKSVTFSVYRLQVKKVMLPSKRQRVSSLLGPLHCRLIPCSSRTFGFSILLLIFCKPYNEKFFEMTSVVNQCYININDMHLIDLVSVLLRFADIKKLFLY